MKCSNLGCLKPSPTMRGDRCNACSKYFKVNGIDRVQRRCSSCPRVLNGNRVGDHCEKCNPQQPCVVIIEGVQCSTLRGSKWGTLCGGHRTQRVKFGEEFKNKKTFMDRSGEYCPTHIEVEHVSYNGRNQCHRCVKEMRIKRVYGLEWQEVIQMLDSQGGKCAFSNCEVEFDEDFNIDHDHSTGKVRGLLCTGHNQLLGHAQDRIEILEDAITYIKAAEYAAWKENSNG